MDATGRQSPANTPNYTRAAYGHPSTYPSPAKSEAENMHYMMNGLGLYDYSMGQPNQLAPTMYPLSPNPTESWTPSLAANSPGMMEGQMRTWNDQYDQMSRPQMHWDQGFSYASGILPARTSPALSDSRILSHRSSMSSSYDPSPYSQESPDYPRVKLEAADWISDEEGGSSYTMVQHPMTVSPDRLATRAAYGMNGTKFDQQYQDPNLSRMTPVSEGRPSSAQTVNTSTARTRSRSITTAENANYQCGECGKLFKRGYNHKAHMETHNPDRPYPHACPYKGCERGFVRKTDLARHEQSVHLRSRNHRCTACDAHFARKDTLRRHTEDGCPKRFEVNNNKQSPPQARGRIGSGNALAGVRQVSHHGQAAGGRR